MKSPINRRGRDDTAVEKSKSLAPEVVSFGRRLEKWSGNNDEELEEPGCSAAPSSHVSGRPVSLGALLIYFISLIFIVFV